MKSLIDLPNDSTKMFRAIYARETIGPYVTKKLTVATDLINRHTFFELTLAAGKIYKYDIIEDAVRDYNSI